MCDTSRNDEDQDRGEERVAHGRDYLLRHWSGYPNDAQPLSGTAMTTTRHIPVKSRKRSPGSDSQRDDRHQRECDCILCSVLKCENRDAKGSCRIFAYCRTFGRALERRSTL